MEQSGDMRVLHSTYMDVRGKSEESARRKERLKVLDTTTVTGRNSLSAIVEVPVLRGKRCSFRFPT